MADSLKVAYYLSRFPRLSETFILREILFLREMGLDVHIFSLLPPLSSSTMHPQVRDMMSYVHYSPYLFSFKLIFAQFHFLFNSPIKYVRALLRLLWQTYPEPSTCVKALLLFPKSVYFARQLEEMKIDHIHSHFVWINGISAQVASDLIGIPNSLHAHAWDIFQREKESVRRQLELATSIVTISDYHCQYLLSLCPKCCSKDIHIVHCGLDPLEFYLDHIPAEDNIVRIISIGRLLDKKGFEYLIDACSLLARKGIEFRCSIIGDGPTWNALQEQINRLNLQDYFSMLGEMNISEILERYRRSDIFALACVITDFGDRDGIPVVLMEAMSMQIPVITTPISGIPELVSDGKNGLLVPQRNPEALAHALEQLIKDQPLRKKLGAQGRQTVLAGFDIHMTAAQMAGIFQEIHSS